MKINRIIRKILAILIPVAVTYFTYPVISAYYFNSLAIMDNSQNPSALLAGALIIVDCIAWLFGLFIFSGDEE